MVLVPDSLVWDFHTQTPLEFIENGQKKTKYPVSGSSEWKCLVDAKGQKRVARLVPHEEQKTTPGASPVSSQSKAIIPNGSPN